ncbi:uncharacterized protein LOC131268653 [Anopheles coustani]|uniref:uncharacterized protein LOC131268653 n=1 Tax=Anopheles coustani TaxID=139045 RepID=UPI002659229B|nr:uncharacterized protein LOC131268653 [Anopheles coustani]
MNKNNSRTNPKGSSSAASGTNDENKPSPEDNHHPCGSKDVWERNYAFAQVYAIKRKERILKQNEQFAFKAQPLPSFASPKKKPQTPKFTIPVTPQVLKHPVGKAEQNATQPGAKRELKRKAQLPKFTIPETPQVLKRGNKTAKSASKVNQQDDSGHASYENDVTEFGN